MSYLMMHMIQSLIYSRRKDFSAHAFDMEFHLTSNFQPNSEYDQGYVANDAEMLVSGVVMTLKKEPSELHWAFLYEFWRCVTDKLGS